MTFSSMVKDELIKILVGSDLENQAELYSIIGFSKTLKINNSDSTLTCENIYAIKRISAILHGDPNNYIKKENSLYCVRLKSEQNICDLINFSKKFIENNKSNFTSQILRGAFLVCGSVTNPQSDYHLEFFLKDHSYINLLTPILDNLKIIRLNYGITKRKTGYSLYLKDNCQITDFLTFIGATNSSMEFMQVKMIKEVRNYVNRTTNFETANITKTTFAASEQIKAIKHIINTVGLDSLPDSLKETAILRLNNPYMSLEELSGLFSKPITKSGVNYRLTKLLKYIKYKK